jgi:hypothetical protein
VIGTAQLLIKYDDNSRLYLGKEAETLRKQEKGFRLAASIGETLRHAHPLNPPIPISDLASSCDTLITAPLIKGRVLQSLSTWMAALIWANSDNVYARGENPPPRSW